MRRRRCGWGGRRDAELHVGDPLGGALQAFGALAVMRPREKGNLLASTVEEDGVPVIRVERKPEHILVERLLLFEILDDQDKRMQTLDHSWSSFPCWSMIALVTVWATARGVGEWAARKRAAAAIGT